MAPAWTTSFNENRSGIHGNQRPVVKYTRWRFSQGELMKCLLGRAARSALTVLTLLGVPPARAELADPADTLSEVVVTAARRELIGTTTTASEGIVVNDELALTPAYRPGQLLETVPGLQVTSHSGEGKANQYLMRGYNLDHGTDLAVSVDGMPINSPTHAHGQGYADLNFMIPELATNIRYTKGTYYADQGDFSAVGSIHLSYLDRIPTGATATIGSLGFQRVFSAGSLSIRGGDLLGALELQHYDGPWDSPDDQRKISTVLRYSNGDERNGMSLTGMFYHALWNATTDQPDRAVAAGLIGRFGTLDPSDGGKAQRGSLSAQYHASLGEGLLDANAYTVNSQLTLWNDFTHFLVDPVNGDQEEQHENRVIVGGGVSYRLAATANTELLSGAQVRYDINDISRLPTRDRRVLVAADNPLSFSETDHVHLVNLSAYEQVTTHWTGWFRTVFGVREDYIHGIDSGTNPGSKGASIFQPKGSLIFAVAPATEVYLSGGRGFHSDDLRGVTQAAATGQVGTLLIARQVGEEIGLRQELLQGKITATLAVFNLDAASETTYNPDVGQDTAGPASRHYGYEINLTYQALRWLEFYASYSGDHARFKTDFDDGTGHIGRYLPNAPAATGSFNIYVMNLGPWSGGLEYRYLGREPLSADNVVQAGGYGECNGDARYGFGDHWTVGLGLYNILGSRANAAQFWYVDRLQGEPAGGVADVHMHPLEPRTVRLTLSKIF
jgi:TonB dependent receptor-like, beta-barrel/TonB-dependent Receptor Plug Domain